VLFYSEALNTGPTAACLHLGMQLENNSGRASPYHAGSLDNTTFWLPLFLGYLFSKIPYLRAFPRHDCVSTRRRAISLAACRAPGKTCFFIFQE